MPWPVPPVSPTWGPCLQSISRVSGMFTEAQDSCQVAGTQGSGRGERKLKAKPEKSQAKGGSSGRVYIQVSNKMGSCEAEFSLLMDVEGHHPCLSQPCLSSTDLNQRTLSWHERSLGLFLGHHHVLAAVHSKTEPPGRLRSDCPTPNLAKCASPSPSAFSIGFFLLVTLFLHLLCFLSLILLTSFSLFLPSSFLSPTDLWYLFFLTLSSFKNVLLDFPFLFLPISSPLSLFYPPPQSVSSLLI